jgi:chromosomal replication initiator protein
VWTQVTLSLRSQLAESVWFSTFQDVSPLESDSDTLRLLAPSAYVRDRILTRYLPLVTAALEDANEGHRRVEIDVETGEAVTEVDSISSNDSISVNDGISDVDTSARNDQRSSQRSLLLDEAGLNPRYTFETFVKGASNQFALAAALRVAETPGRSYNPLFIYGSAGLGKTHLLHAIGHYVHSNYQHHEVRYVSTETFMNEYVDAIRQNTTNSLRRRYRDIDVLLIDDIQFIAGKEGLQEEFFHTFNSLHGANKQVVISSDRMPDAIPTLEERLRGRFKWGLITDIQPPDLETRLAILRNKSERDRVMVPDETLEFIATNIATNIRELEGALIRVTAYASLNQVPITTELAQTQLADLLNDSKPKARTDEELLADIAAILKFPVEDLKGRSRQRPLVTGRQIAMYVFRELTDLSYPAIARLFGGRDHTTVIHANEKIQRLMSERKQIYDQVTDLLQQLKA